MYDELKEKCRACSQGCIYPSECNYFNKPPFRCMRQLLSEAADAIEELQNRVLIAPIDSYAGLKRKYIVLKADTGEDVPDCFVLRPAKDKAAVEALRAYAKATDNDLLAADIYRWVGPLSEQPKEEL